jgi:hypothetical protein
MAEQIGKISIGDPEWRRLPKRNVPEPTSGLSRQVLCRLIKDGQVRSIAFVGVGRKRGARVFSLKDLRMHMEQLGREQGLTPPNSPRRQIEAVTNFASENQGPQNQKQKDQND